MRRLLRVAPVTPYYADEHVTLYLGDARDVLPELAAGGPVADAAVCDPPYAQTPLDWDRWIDGWPSAVAASLPPVTSMWCFGTLRMFIDRHADFAMAWKLAEDAVWEKHNGSGFGDDSRHFRVHESIVRYYRGPWVDVSLPLAREVVGAADKSTRRQANGAAHRGEDRASSYVDDGLRLPRTVRKYPSVRGRGRNETEKPVGLVSELVCSLVPAGGTVLDPTSGSGTTGDAARQTGRRAVLIEKRESQCEIAARRFDAGVLA